MHKRVAVLFIILPVIVIALTLFLYFYPDQHESKEDTGHLVAVNEIEQLLERGDVEEASEKLFGLEEKLRENDENVKRDTRILVVGGICTVSLLIAGIFVFVTVLHPLNSISKFSSEIAKGNLDIPLRYERGSEVGEFSWAFDSMRIELRKARASEREAIENNKTVIATLSHDIKTPIASIRAYAEGLEANMDSSPEKRALYLSTIMKKSDEVSKVTDDLLLHSLSDMRRLKVEPQKLPLSAFVEETVRSLDPDEKEVSFDSRGISADVMADPDRLRQCIENLITNARKYAETNILVYFEKGQERDGDKSGPGGNHSGEVAVCVKDFGKGIPDEDMPFIFDKFYRGHNHGQKPGSGLGLYIVKYLMTQMNGDVLLNNTPDGLLVKLILPME